MLNLGSLTNSKASLNSHMSAAERDRSTDAGVLNPTLLQQREEAQKEELERRRKLEIMNRRRTSVDVGVLFRFKQGGMQMQTGHAGKLGVPQQNSGS